MRWPWYGRWLAVGFASGTWPRAETQQLVWANVSMIGVLAAGNTRAELDNIHASLAPLSARVGCAAW